MKLVWTWFTCCGVMASPHILHSHLSVPAPSGRPPSAAPSVCRIARGCSRSCGNRWPRHRGLERGVRARAPSACSRMLPRHRSPTGPGAFLPVVHLVLLETAGRAEPPNTGQPDRLLDVRRGGLVDVDPRPDLGLVATARMPDAKGARAGAEQGEVGKQGADDRAD